MKRLFLLVFLFFSPTISMAGVEQVLQMVDYVAVDYSGAVSKGKIVNQDEYAEMTGFAKAINEQLSQLPATSQHSTLVKAVQTLTQQIHSKTDANNISEQAGKIRQLLIQAYDMAVAPRLIPDIKLGHKLYTEQCTSCHGTEGRGDGPMALSLSPPPINFHEFERYQQRTLYGLYSTITLGVANTGMQSYATLSDAERWSLAFYVSQLAPSTALVSQGEQVFKTEPGLALNKPRQLTSITPAQAQSEYGDKGAAMMAYLRSHPEQIFAQKHPLQHTRVRLQEMLSAYRSGDEKAAYQLAVNAYLEGFELVEKQLNRVDSGLRLSIEQSMIRLRNTIHGKAGIDVITQQVAQINEDLDLAEQRMDENTLSSGGAFASSFFILIREGLEALLVVVALLAFVVKTGRKDAIKFVHVGWLGALALGALTWIASITFIDISGGSREITEGIAAMVAALVLFYVGFWLHDKSSAMQWKRFIEASVSKALSGGTLWGLSALAFIAVYREVFETLLFYEALWTQLEESGRNAAMTGFISSAVLLVILGWLMIRYSVRLPLRQFFAASGILMFTLAVVFAGKGIAALQEAGLLPVNTISFIRIDWLGIYPNLETLGLQIAMILLGAYLWFWRKPSATPMAT